MDTLSLEKLKEALYYNPETGKFFWKERPREHFKTEGSWKQVNGRFAGREAGHIGPYYSDNISYIQLRVFNKLYLGHRLAWFYMKGEWPKLIDHEDGNGLNNKLDNLRNGDNILNGRNCRLSKNNTSGVNGIYFSNQIKKWVAEGHYTEDGINKKKYLGSFIDILDAKAAREVWEKSVGGFSERHGK